MPSAEHLFWPELDVDLAVEAIGDPDKSPLVSKPGSLETWPGRQLASLPRRIGLTGRLLRGQCGSLSWRFAAPRAGLP
ncbi:MAG: hypothetical protein L6Q83_05225 [Gammaproteobacteria bacterium]|nr:hypothetical protein [Gammaproteobacteria bacterium]